MTNKNSRQWNKISGNFLHKVGRIALEIIKLMAQYFLGIGLAFVIGKGVLYICYAIPYTFISYITKNFGSEFYYDLYAMALLGWPLGLSIGVYLVDRLSRKKPKPRIRKMAIAFFAALVGIVFISYMMLPILGTNIIIFGLMEGELELVLIGGGLFCVIGYNATDWLWKILKND